MNRWFCGFSSTTNSLISVLPQPLNGKTLWEGANQFWICGTWQKQQIITLFEGPVRLAIVGTCLAPYQTLVELFQNTIKSKDYSQLIRLPGSYNLIVQDETDTYIFTDLAGVKPIFYTEYSSNIVYSSLAVPLQQLIKAEVDKTWLASFLVFLSRPNEIKNRSPFRNIQSLPPGHYLQISSGKVTCKRYWNPPEQYISFSEAAAQLREQLLTAVEGRINLYGNISSDLSGGFDSTTLALLAAKSLEKQGQKIPTITFKSLAAAESEDVKWAEHAVSLYPNIASVMIEDHDIPADYSNLETTPLTDAPNPAIIAIGKLNYLMKTINSKESQLHMSGEGGDAVLLAPDSYVIEVFKRARIKTFIKHIYGRSRLTNLSPLTLVSSALKLGLTSYNQWLLKQAQRLKNESILHQPLMYQLSISEMMTWDFEPQVASWYTKELVESVVAELQGWATVATPFANIPWKNEYLAELYLTGFSARIMQQIGEICDVNLEFPYLDSLVIDACLSAKPEERTTPFAYKPLLSKALQDDLPQSIFTRTTKGDYGTDELSGFHQHQHVIKELFQTSILADIGLIDTKNFQAGIEQFSMGLNMNSSHLNQTIATEIWLRRLTDVGNSFWSLS